MLNVNLCQLKSVIPTEAVYKQVGDKALHLYIFPPKGEVKGCVINIHGGGWRAETPKRLFPHAAYFSENDALGICVEYRLHDVAKGYDVRDCLEDCVDALLFVRKYVRDTYGDVPITALGDSAGGYLAVCLGCQTILDRIRPDVQRADFVVDLNGIVDLTGKWSYAIDKKASDTDNQQTLQMLYSPLYNVKADDAPVLLMHGDTDEIVALEDSKKYNEELKTKGIKSELVVLEKARHAFILFDYEHDNQFVADILYKVALILKGNGVL